MQNERGETENVRVVVRCRPLSMNETKQGHKSIIEIDEVQGTLVANNTAAGEPPKTFAYDSVFGPKSKQTDVYNQAARPIVENILQGYNGTIFAYGQTGAGKTFTMQGHLWTPELKGIIPNSFAHIFDHIAKCGDEKRFLVRVSYLQIYKEDIRDLLAKNRDHKLEIKQREDVGVYVKDLSSVTVGCADEMYEIMTLGNKHRAVAATLMGEAISRSDAIFTVTVECSELGPDKQRHFRVGKLHLVDLAGSERQSKTGATGEGLKEAANISQSLSPLGSVISALVDAKSSHVPYRNSKLTRLLQDSLGGNSKTVMNAAKINQDPKDALLRKFQAEIEELRKQLEEDGEEGEEEEEEETEEGQEQSQTKHKKNKPKHLSEDKMRQIESQISADRKKLEEQNDMAEGQRHQLAEQLTQREADLQAAREEHEILQKKLQQIEKKVIVGGENLLEKAEQQAKLLEQSNRELEERRNKETELKRALEQAQN